MFKVEFCCNSFHGELAWMEQDYTVPDGVEVVEVDRFVGLLDEGIYYEATSPREFTVTITTEAWGQDAHCDGESFCVASKEL